jgi:hypothetical protein
VLAFRRDLTGSYERRSSGPILRVSLHTVKQIALLVQSIAAIHPPIAHIEVDQKSESGS